MGEQNPGRSGENSDRCFLIHRSRLLEWEANDEAGSLSDFCAEVHGPSVLLHNLTDQGKTQTRSMSTRRKQGLEYPGNVGLQNPTSCVGNFDQHELRWGWSR